MATTIRRLESSVQKLASIANLSPTDVRLATDVIVGITTKGSCHLSEIARVCGRDDEPLIRTERRLSNGLAREPSQLDELRYAWLAMAAGVAGTMPFICVDGSDASKPYGQAFEFLDTISDRSDKHKTVGPGYWLVSVEATDGEHRNLPLWMEVISTKAPTYSDWYAGYRRAILEVGHRCDSAGATWLFDRGFDSAEFMSWLQLIDITWVVRQKQDRNVVLGNGDVVGMRAQASSLHTPHEVSIPYVDKSTHERRSFNASFGYAPVKLPGSDERYFLVVVDCGRKEPLVMLTNADLTSAQRTRTIVLAYVRRWGIEEGLRCWKQKTGIEDFRVRGWASIQRLFLLSMIAYGLQAMWLFTSPAMARQYVSRVKAFVQMVMFVHYRLWDGVQLALRNSG